jgi:hypothetical protein
MQTEMPGGLCGHPGGGSGNPNASGPFFDDADAPDAAAATTGATARFERTWMGIVLVFGEKRARPYKA